MSRMYPQAIAYGYDEVLPSGTFLKFVLDSNQPPIGWEIYRTTNSQVCDFQEIVVFY